MNRLIGWSLAPTLAVVLTVASGATAAQTYRGAYVQPSSTGRYEASGGQYDYARVIRVDPVIDSRGGYAQTDQRCYQRRDHAAGGGGYDDGYYGNERYGSDPYYPQDNRDYGGNQFGGTMATVVGGLVGAVIGSQVGGGSARYATSAIGTMVGGMAGRSIYDQSRRQRDYAGTVTVCDPVAVDGRYASNGRGVTEYDVTYEYAGRQYTTRTQYHPGDRIRVRVDVQPY